MKSLKKPNKVQSLEQLAFTLIVPSYVFACLMGIFTHVIELLHYNGKLSFVVLISSCLALILLYIYGMRKKKFNICYPLSCFVISVIMIPTLFLLNGGFYSGMAIYLLCGSLFCCLCSNKKARVILFFMTQIASGIVFYLAYIGKGVQYSFDSSYFNYDIMITYEISALVLFFIFHIYMNTAKRFESGTSALKNYVDEKVADTLIDNEELGLEKAQGQLKKVTVLFADIHNFTSTSEKMSPEMVTQYVNLFLEICDNCINENNGVLDKYIGDCAMAYWIDEREDGSGIDSALKATLEIQKTLSESANIIRKEFHEDLQFSAGLCYGNVVMGDMGSNRRKEFTVMGDTVNTASRIQSIAATGQILVNEEIVSMVKDRLIFNKIKSDVQVKGKKQKLSLYEVIGFKN